MAKRRRGGSGASRGPRRRGQRDVAARDEPARPPGRWPDLALIVIAVLAVAVTAYFLATLPHDDGGAPPPPNGDWLATYSPAQGLGTAEDDWWTVQPELSPSSGSDVVHPAWVTDLLDDGPLIILTHSQGCAPCIDQGNDVKAVMDVHGTRITYLDLLTGGSDKRANDTFDAYDANGDPHYIPLTIVLTKAVTPEGTKIVWHATEGATGAQWIESYVKDAIYYHSRD